MHSHHLDVTLGEKGARAMQAIVEDFENTVLKQLEPSAADTVREALTLAIQIHQTQGVRDDGVPFVQHPISVARRIAVEFHILDVNTLCAALLHDSVEDQAKALASCAAKEFETNREAREAALEVLNEQFGTEVATAVKYLSNPLDTDKKARKLRKQEGGELSDIKNQLYLEHIEQIVAENQIAMVVKLSDFCDNFTQIALIDDTERREELTAKYSPVRDLFVNSLSHLQEDHPLQPAVVDIKMQLSN